jgi:hypothetical protein
LPPPRFLKRMTKTAKRMTKTALRIGNSQEFM